MKLSMALAVLLMVISGCASLQNERSFSQNDSIAISDVKELMLNDQDLLEVDMTSIGCLTEEYETNEYSPISQYSMCNYTIKRLNDTEVIIELQKFTNLHDLNGTYQYSSLHLRGSQGIISEDDHGDMSRFYVNNESDVYYYHLWIGKNKYLIHVTSKGSKEAKEYIARIGQRTLSKFG